MYNKLVARNKILILQIYQDAVQLRLIMASYILKIHVQHGLIHRQHTSRQVTMFQQEHQIDLKYDLHLSLQFDIVILQSFDVAVMVLIANHQCDKHKVCP